MRGRTAAGGTRRRPRYRISGRGAARLTTQCSGWRTSGSKPRARAASISREVEYRRGLRDRMASEGDAKVAHQARSTGQEGTRVRAARRRQRRSPHGAGAGSGAGGRCERGRPAGRRRARFAPGEGELERRAVGQGEANSAPQGPESSAGSRSPGAAYDGPRVGHQGVPDQLHLHLENVDLARFIGRVRSNCRGPPGAPGSSSRALTCSAEVRAPVSSLAATARRPRSGRSTRSRQPATGRTTGSRATETATRAMIRRRALLPRGVGQGAGVGGLVAQ